MLSTLALATQLIQNTEHPKDIWHSPKSFTRTAININSPLTGNYIHKISAESEKDASLWTSVTPAKRVWLQSEAHRKHARVSK